MTEIKITKATLKDASKIGALAYQVALIHYREMEKEFKQPDIESQTDYIRNSIKDKNLYVSKAEIANEIVGYVIYRFNTLPDKYFQFQKRVFVDSICVDEKYRGQGIGTALIKAVEDDARKNDVSIAEIDVYTFNKAAEKMYNRLGYADVRHYKRKFIA